MRIAIDPSAFLALMFVLGLTVLTLIGIGTVAGTFYLAVRDRDWLLLSILVGGLLAVLGVVGFSYILARRG